MPPFEIEAGLVRLELGGDLIELLLADQFVAEQLLAPFVVRLAQFEVGLGFRHGGGELRVVELHQQVALRHLLPLGDQNLFDRAVRLGLDFNHLVGGDGADQGERFGDSLGPGFDDNRLHGEPSRRSASGTGRGLFLAARPGQRRGEQCRETKVFHEICTTHHQPAWLMESAGNGRDALPPGQIPIPQGFHGAPRPIPAGLTFPV